MISTDDECKWWAQTRTDDENRWWEQMVSTHHLCSSVLSICTQHPNSPSVLSTCTQYLYSALSVLSSLYASSVLILCTSTDDEYRWWVQRCTQWWVQMTSTEGEEEESEVGEKGGVTTNLSSDLHRWWIQIMSTVMNTWWGADDEYRWVQMSTDGCPPLIPRRSLPPWLPSLSSLLAVFTDSLYSLCWLYYHCSTALTVSTVFVFFMRQAIGTPIHCLCTAYSLLIHYWLPMHCVYALPIHCLFHYSLPIN
jgi:hypothetical protein